MTFQLDRSIRFGSQLFVNPEDTPETLRPCIAMLAKSGFTLIRLFLPWNQLEPRPGEYRWSPFDEVFDEAHASGIKIVATLMSCSPPGWMGLTNGLQEVANLDEPEFFAQSLGHLRAVVEHYRGHPALDSWILWNEPSRRLRPSHPATMQAFREFLERRYGGDLAAYSATHYQPAESFAAIKVPPLDEGGFTSHRAKVEWLTFTMDNLRQKLAAMAAEVRRLDPLHPIHVNPHRVSQCLADDGQSIWQEASLVDFMGCSAHPAWHSVRFPRHRYPDSIAMYADMMRSCTPQPDGYFWVTELQGGTTLMSSFEPLLASPGETRVWLWEGIAAGAKAVVYWCAHGRTDGYEAGEWDLLDHYGQPSPQLMAISETIRQLTPHLPRLALASRPPADVGIIVSEASMMLDLVEGTDDNPQNPRNRQKSADAVSGAYLLAADLSLETNFYDLARLQATPLDTLPPVLIAPGLVVVDADTIAFLERVVRSGRLLVGDGFFAWKDASGRLAQELWPAADALWGAKCSGYEALGDQSGATTTVSALRGWFMRGRLAPTAGTFVAESWTDAGAAIMERRVGRGLACRIGTTVFQHYLTHEDPVTLCWFESLVRSRLPAAPRLIERKPGVRLRRLQLGANHVVVLLNTASETREVRLNWPGHVWEQQEIRVPAQDAVVLT